jgi:hypothetical protein
MPGIVVKRYFGTPLHVYVFKRADSKYGVGYAF